ncbi:VOC family protein [Modestobacter excelsi]|uniref:VOC family protein n=1 Tax=Modestobacter excelsi TaxID=2213161 RepID=UPI00110CD945|nr:VOC family protein [Modestobacter excelsi]
MTVTGPESIAVQVRDVEAAATCYEERLGLRRARTAPPGAVVFATEPIAFAVRTPLATPGVPVLAAPSDSPFGRTSTFADPDGYAITVHDQH